MLYYSNLFFAKLLDCLGKKFLYLRMDVKSCSFLYRVIIFHVSLLQKCTLTFSTLTFKICLIPEKNIEKT